LFKIIPDEVVVVQTPKEIQTRMRAKTLEFLLELA
jgi:hypothetical protein